MSGPYKTIARVTPMREVLDKRPTPTRVVAAPRQLPDDRPGGVGPRGIPAHVFVEQDEDTYTPAAAEKLGRALIKAARYARAK